jgi:hypothetical protein
MRKSRLVVPLGIAVLAALAPSPASADFGTPRQNFGLGIGMGTGASGLSGKFMLGTGAAIQGVVGVWGGEDGGDHSGPGRPRLDGIALSVDYLFEMPTLAKSEYFNLDWSFGLGGGIGVSTGGGAPSAAVAGIAGLEFNFTRVPFDIVIEYRPAVGIVPNPWIGLVGFTAHVRVWF